MGNHRKFMERGCVFSVVFMTKNGLFNGYIPMPEDWPKRMPDLWI